MYTTILVQPFTKTMIHTIAGQIIATCSHWWRSPSRKIRIPLVSNLGKWSILTNIFQMGWNHQLDTILIYTAPNTLQPPGFSPNLLKRDNRQPKVRSGTLHLLKKMLAASPKKRPKAHKGCKVPEGGGGELVVGLAGWLIWLVGWWVWLF